LVRASDNDTGLYILNLQSSVGATSQTWVSRLVVEKGGNVGIGTTNPSNNHKLEVSGAMATTGINLGNMSSLGSLGSGYLYLPYTGGIGFRSADGSAAKALISADNSSNLLLNSGGGNVGIGTSNPTGSLDVSGSIYIKSSSGGVLYIPRNADPSHGLSIGEQNAIGSKSAVIRTGGGVSEYLFIDAGLNDSNVAGNIALAVNNTGSVGIGTYLPLSKFHQVGGGNYYTADARFGGSSTSFGVEIKYDQGGATNGSIYCSPGYASSGIVFKLGAGSGNTNQLVLTGGGEIVIGGAATTGAALTIYNPVVGGSGAEIRCTANSGGNPIVLYNRMSVVGTTSNYILAGQDSQQDKIYIYGNGNIVNRNNSYGTLSDVSLKENITDATPKLDNLLQLKVRNFNLIDDENKTKQIGFIAQEFEEVFPSMIDIDGKTNMKTIKTSVLVPMLVKAIQELEARVKELENK
jgi:hypothetical protein